VVLYKVHSLHEAADVAQSQKIALDFYRTSAGAEPVREWLKSLTTEERKAVGFDLMRVQWRWPVGMPLCRAMGGGVWEVRTDLPKGRTARVLFCFQGQRLVALHGFIKKTQKTPDGDLKLAQKRKKDAER
jgi:phage-related protein